MNNKSERPDELLTIAVLITLLLLVGIVGLFWSTWNRLVLAPTPTMTATVSLAPTETPDIRATQIANELATQQATTTVITAIALLSQTPSITTTQPFTISDFLLPESTVMAIRTLTAVAAEALPPGEIMLTAQAAPSQTERIQIPVFIDAGRGGNDTPGGEITATVVISPPTTVPDEFVNGTAAPNQIDATPADNPNGPAISTAPTTPESILVPIIVNDPGQPSAIPSQAVTPAQTVEGPDIIIPGATLIPTEAPLPTDTPTPVATATATPLPTPTPTPTRFLTIDLTGNVRAGGADMRQGPSSIYNVVMRLNENQQVTMRGRDASGEWAYICCPDPGLNGGWIRQADALPVNNQFDSTESPPEGANPNDVRWLKIEPLLVNLPPVPQSFAPAANVFPLPRYNNANQGRLSLLPPPPLDLPVWQIRQRATGTFDSPVAVSQLGVLANSADGHLYNFSFAVGDEIWRYKYEDDGRSRRAPIISDSFIYAVDESGFVYSLADNGSSAQLQWRRQLQKDNQILQPATEMTLLANFLFVGATANDAHYIVGIDRTNGSFRFTESIPGTRMSNPAIGGQSIFVATDVGIFTRDVVYGTVVWSRAEDTFTQISAPPMYSTPGVESLAELYLARTNGEIIALNANTGEELWRIADGDPVTGMALDDTNIYLSGGNFVKAINRDDHTRRWRVDISGDVPGGPLVSPEYVMVVTVTGSVVFINPGNGVIVSESTVGTVLTSGYAVTSQYLFLPSPDNTVRAYANP